MRAILPVCLPLLLLSVALASEPSTESAADMATRALLDALEERQMPDIALAVLARIETDPDASAELKREAAFRRAAALVDVSMTEADSGRKAKLLDDAQAALDSFLKSGTPDGRQAIAAYTQRGRLLLERGRAKARQAVRPGADAKTLQAEAAAFFDEAYKSLKGTSKPGEPITTVTNAEDAVLKVLREIDAKLAAAAPKPAPPPKDDGTGKPPKPPKPKAPRLSAAEQRELEALKSEQAVLRGKLVQTRVEAVNTVFEKANAYPEKSKEWTELLTSSATMYKELAQKYPTMTFGLLAGYYEGRNYALLEQWDKGVSALEELAAIDHKAVGADAAPLAIRLRSMALNTTLECLLAQKKYDPLEPDVRNFALEDVGRLPGGQLDANWLGLKYRAAKLFDAQADALEAKDPKSRADQARLQADAKKLAIEVAKANADFAAEARELSAKLGKVVAEGERTFAAAFDEAKVALATMQGHAAEAKAAAAAQDAAKEQAARQAAAEARTVALAKFEEALKLAGIAEPLAADPAGDDKLAAGVSLEDVNQSRYLLTYLLFQAEKFPEAAAMGRMLTERYPNATGSRQAAKVALAAFQQAGQRAEGEARQQARTQAAAFAGVVMKTWPAEPESADAALILLNGAITAREPQEIVALIEQVPAASPRRPEVLLRAGPSLWREVQEARRREEGDRPEAAVLADWRAATVKALDEGLAGLGDVQSLPPDPLGTLALSSALSRVQIAMDDGDDARAAALLQHPVYGPWTLVTGGNAAAVPAALTEATLTLALRLFVQAGDFDKAETARGLLEKAAGEGEEAAAKLTGMFMAMARDLQAQLQALVSGDNAAKPEVRQRAERILAGFEKFLDGIAARDPKFSSQMWVATTYLTLGSGKGLGTVVPPAKAAAYLKKAADVYQKLLDKKDDPELAKFEPSIRLKMADIYRVLGDWEKAQAQLDWILADAKRQNSLEVQIMAAEVLQAAGRAAAQAGDGAKADGLLREAAGGRKAPPPIVIWGWNTIATRVGRQGTEGAGEKQRQNRDMFFEARLKGVECLLERARLPGQEKGRETRLKAAETVITMTHSSYPDLGGEGFAKRFERILKEVQRELGKQPDGFRALEAQAPQAAPVGAAP
jgi:hypothetical protein